VACSQAAALRQGLAVRDGDKIQADASSALFASRDGRGAVEQWNKLSAVCRILFPDDFAAKLRDHVVHNFAVWLFGLYQPISCAVNLLIEFDLQVRTAAPRIRHSWKPCDQTIWRL
jgi:hypothetical protein